MNSRTLSRIVGMSERAGGSVGQRDYTSFAGFWTALRVARFRHHGHDQNKRHEAEGNDQKENAAPVPYATAASLGLAGRKRAFGQAAQVLSQAPALFASVFRPV